MGAVHVYTRVERGRRPTRCPVGGCDEVQNLQTSPKLSYLLAICCHAGVTSIRLPVGGCDEVHAPMLPGHWGRRFLCFCPFYHEVYQRLGLDCRL
jgi:hypothetical protein